MLRVQARGRGCAQGTAGSAGQRQAGPEAAGDARAGWAAAAAAAADAEAAHAGGTQAALTRLQASPEFAHWRARRGWAAADVARANRCVALLKVCGGVYQSAPRTPCSPSRRSRARVWYLPDGGLRLQRSLNLKQRKR